jgi:putative oxidoreductase
MTRSNKLVTAARLVLGLVFTLSGLNHLLALVPLPPMAGNTALFIEGLRQTHYFFPLLGMVEVIGGALLLSGRMVPLALVALAPVALNATAFHLFLAPQALGVMGLILVAGIFLAARHRTAFTPLLGVQPVPLTAGLRAVELALGLAFVASGAAGISGHLPPASTAGAAVMLKGMAAAGYFLPLLSAVQLFAGGLLIARRFVGLALVLLAPLVVQVLAYRLYVATPGMLLVGLAMVAALVRLALAYRQRLAALTTGARSPALHAPTLAVPVATIGR